MIGCLTETTTCVVAKPLVFIMSLSSSFYVTLQKLCILPLIKMVGRLVKDNNNVMFT